MPYSSTERQAPDTGRGNDATRRDHPECMRRMVDVSPGATASNSNPLFHRINAHSLQFRQINYRPAVAGSQPAAVVAAAANRQQMRSS